jgi:hypothetical protein
MLTEPVQAALRPSALLTEPVQAALRPSAMLTEPVQAALRPSAMLTEPVQAALRSSAMLTEGIRSRFRPARHFEMLLPQNLLTVFRRYLLPLLAIPDPFLKDLKLNKWII